MSYENDIKYMFNEIKKESVNPAAHVFVDSLQEQLRSKTPLSGKQVWRLRQIYDELKERQDAHEDLYGLEADA